MKSEKKIVPDMDLNLLRVLVALDRARNVSRAAELLDMSQSGFSTALMRLRQQFGDELFIRSAGMMQPTARAQRMLVAASEVLNQVSEQIIEEPVFDPANSVTEFKIAMADVAEVIYLPKLLQHFAKVAPVSTVSTQLPSGETLREAMGSGEIDLAVGYFPDLSSQQFFKQRLYKHTYSCIARRGHPMGSKLTIKAYERWGHAVAATPARSTALLDRFLESKGIKRRIVMRTPHHLVLPILIAETDLIATVPLTVADRLAENKEIQVFSLPFVPPSFLVQQHWHRIVHKDSRNQWLRSQIHMLFGEK